MSTTSLIPAAQSKALLREIEQQTREVTRAITASAEQEARAIVEHAHATARRRMREAIAGLRAEGTRRIGRASAQLDTDARQRDQQEAARAIDRAWPLLLDALVARWSDPGARSAWTDGLARCAHDRLRAGPLRVEHPADWSADEQQRFRDVLAAGDRGVAFAEDRDLVAGLRIRAGDANLDGTPRGLLTDSAGIAALLLAELAPPDEP